MKHRPERTPPPATPKLPPLTGWDRTCLWLSTGLGIGYAAAAVRPVAQNSYLARKMWTGGGFFATLAAALAVLAGVRVAGWLGAAGLIAFSLLAVGFSNRAELCLGTKDDSRIVIDEIAGYFWSVAFLPLDAMPPAERIGFLIAAFVLFRIFDVFKIPSRRVQKLPGGWGIMTDDILSGLLVNLFLQAAARFC